MITKRKYPWIGEQTWREILFLHWSVAPEIVQPFVPTPFKLDLYNNKAWVSIVIFQAEQTVPRGVPKVFSYRDVTQINVRTYVLNRANAERGVYFFSLHANSLLAAIGAKMCYGLPFRYAVTFKEQKNNYGYLHTVKNNRTIFTGSYEVTQKRTKTDLTMFLTERYCIWNKHRNKIIKIPIMHTRWDLYRAIATIRTKELLPSFIQDENEMLAHYAREKVSYLYPYETFGYINK